MKKGPIRLYCFIYLLKTLVQDKGMSPFLWDDYNILPTRT
jgi:hypothetical protein